MTASGEKTGARWVTVDSESADRRLDNFLLGELRGLPRSRIYQMIRKGEVRVNKGRVRPAYRLAVGDTVRIPPVRESGADAPSAGDRGGWILEHVLYEDEALLVLDKPAGVAVHGGSGISFGAIERLRAARPDCRYLELVHRLDRATSGCLLVAKKRSALRGLHEQLRNNTVEKHYTALLAGRWDGGPRTVDLPLVVTHRKNGERHVRPGREGKPAHTRFVPEERLADAVYCRIELGTGRTHQIRVHAAAIGHPVLGDERYGTPASAAAAKRLCLHACSLGFEHPVSGEAVKLEAPLPGDFSAALSALRRAADNPPA